MRISLYEKVLVFTCMATGVGGLAICEMVAVNMPDSTRGLGVQADVAITMFLIGLLVGSISLLFVPTWILYLRSRSE